MALPDSRHNVTNPRWSSTTGYVVSANAVEPPGPQKDTGWQPGVDVPVGEWWNWLHLQTFLMFAYLESFLSKLLTTNQVMRQGKVSSTGTVTAGAGLSVNVTAARVWIDGAMYEVPAAVNLALAAADPTDPRQDLVVARLVLGVPAYAVITGTPDPAPVIPSPLANDVPIQAVRVNAAAVVPGTLTDQRVYGDLELDHLLVDNEFELGDLGGGDFLLEGTNSGSGTLRVGKGATTILGDNLITLFDAIAQIFINPEAVNFTAAIRRKYDLPIGDFQDRDGTERNGALGGGHALALAAATAAGAATAAVRVPNGGEIKALRIYVWRGTNAPGSTAFLYSYAKGTGVRTTEATIALDAGSGSTGNYTREVTGINLAVDQSKTYEVVVLFSGAGGDIGIRGAEVEWDESKPFDGI